MVCLRVFIILGLLAVWSVGALASDNRSNDYLLSLSKSDQAKMLGQVAGEGCVGRTPFYQGTGTTGLAKGLAYWSIRCTDGRSYEVEVHPDGTSRVLECAMIEAVHAGHCFQKLQP